MSCTLPSSLRLILIMGSLIVMIVAIIPGVWSGDWGVTFENQCALKGTSVVMKCKYDYPPGHMVTSVKWHKVRLVNSQYRLVDLARLPSPPDFEYIGNYRGDCSLKINDVQRTDEGWYYFSFETTFNRWTSATSAHLSVKELTALVQPSTVTEGDDVSLTCVSGCPTPETIVWFRDGQPVPKPAFKARTEDAGRYFCVFLGQQDIRSVPVALNVQYRPMNVAVSVDSPHVVEGNSVNLTCSCAANPAADNYIWYKRIDSPGSSSMIQVGSGQVLSLLSVDPSHTGLYLCQAINSLGENSSTEVLLTMEGKEHGIQPLPVLAGIGVSLFATLVVVLFLFWRKWRSHAEKKQTVFDFVLSGRVSSSSANEDQADPVYANIYTFPTSPPPVTTAQDITSASQKNPNYKHDSYTFYEDEVIYSTVTIEPKNLSFAHHKNSSRAPQNSLSKGENDNSVIYATVATSS